MRTCVFVSFLMAVSCCGVVLAADAQTAKTTATNSKVAIAKSANAGLAQAAELGAPDQLASRPDANRYYWNNGQWWYHTPDNNWMRWNGAIWVRHNRANSMQPVTSSAGSEPSVVSQPRQVPAAQPVTAAPSYRYQINRRRAGL